MLILHFQIHLHGHDFYILGSGDGQFDTVNGPATLQYDNPTRRDVVTLPGGGWVVVAFMTDNPGVRIHIPVLFGRSYTDYMAELVDALPHRLARKSRIGGSIPRSRE